MNKEIGDELTAKGVVLQPAYGSTETGFMNLVLPREPRGADWEYFEFVDSIKPGLLDDGDGHVEMHLIVSHSEFHRVKFTHHSVYSHALLTPRA